MPEIIPEKLWMGTALEARNVTGGVVRLTFRFCGLLLFFVATAGVLSADEGTIGKRLIESKPIFQGAFRTNPADPRSFALSDHLPQLAVFETQGN